MITKELAKRLIEQAEYNCSGEKVEYDIDDIMSLVKTVLISFLHHPSLARHLLSAMKMERLISSMIGRAAILPTRKKLVTTKIGSR